MQGGLKGWEKTKYTGKENNKVHGKPPSRSEGGVLSTFYTSQAIFNQDPGLG